MDVEKPRRKGKMLLLQNLEKLFRTAFHSKGERKRMPSMQPSKQTLKIVELLKQEKDKYSGERLTYLEIGKKFVTDSSPNGLSRQRIEQIAKKYDLLHKANPAPKGKCLSCEKQLFYTARRYCNIECRNADLSISVYCALCGSKKTIRKSYLRAMRHRGQAKTGNFFCNAIHRSQWLKQWYIGIPRDERNVPRNVENLKVLERL